MLQASKRRRGAPEPVDASAVGPRPTANGATTAPTAAAVAAAVAASQPHPVENGLGAAKEAPETAAQPASSAGPDAEGPAAAAAARRAQNTASRWVSGGQRSQVACSSHPLPTQTAGCSRQASTGVMTCQLRMASGGKLISSSPGRSLATALCSQPTAHALNPTSSTCDSSNFCPEASAAVCRQQGSGVLQSAAEDDAGEHVGPDIKRGCARSQRACGSGCTSSV